jgi:hypothetical protein
MAPGVREASVFNGGTELSEQKTVGAAQTITTTSNEGNLALQIRLLSSGSARSLHAILQEAHEVGRAGRILRLRVVVDILPLSCNGSGSQGSVGLQQGTLGTLPPELGHVATADLED